MPRLSAVQICNLALGRIGSSQRIESLTEESREARECNLAFSVSRDYLLYRYMWPFATRRFELLDAGLDDLPDEWAFAYHYPPHCLRLINIVTGRDVWRPEQAVPFRVESHPTADGKVIYSNQPNAVMRYVRDDVSAGDFTAAFATALAWRLAYEIALPLSGKQTLADRILQVAEVEIPRAAALDLNENELGPDPPAGIIAIRDGGDTAAASGDQYDDFTWETGW